MSAPSAEKMVPNDKIRCQGVVHDPGKGHGSVARLTLGLKETYRFFDSNFFRIVILTANTDDAKASTVAPFLFTRSFTSM